MLHFPSSLRSSFSLLSGSFLLSLLVTGCGVGTLANTGVANTPGASFQGKLYGGQQPVSNARVSVYTFGNGYGVAGREVAYTYTGTDGSFSFGSGTGAYTCDQSDEPVYLLSSGGDPGFGTNVNAVLAAPLGTCSHAQSSYVTINEVTTIAMAYAFSHYFNNAGTGVTTDAFGAPATGSTGSMTYSKGLVLQNNYIAPLIATTVNGYATASSGALTTEQQKVYLLADIIANCVNSTGVTGANDTTSSCGKLFYNTTSGTTTPTDTLQAAVQMCLHPTQNASTLFNTVNTKIAFPTTTTSVSDLSLAVSFTASSLGLSVDTNTLSTIDIDKTNRVWFPSTATGNVGIAYFDPTTQTFSTVYNNTGMVHPNQIAIDNNGYAWVSDTQGPTLSAYNTAAPSTASALTRANTVSYAVAVAPDSTVRTELYDSSLSKYRLGTAASPLGAYTELATPAFYATYQGLSLAFDNAGNLEFTQFLPSTPRFYHSELSSTGTFTAQVDTAADSAGQVVWNGLNLYGSRSNIGSGAGDGFCMNVSATGTCYSVESPNYSVYTGLAGVAVDGARTLWGANSKTASVTQAPLFSTTDYDQPTSGANQIVTHFYTHNSSNGATLTNPEGIAVDNAGNVWVANAGCSTTGCTPGAFVLSVLIGAGAPTVTPVAAQIVGGASLAGTQPNY